MQFIIQYSSDYVYVFFLRPNRADNSSPEAIEISARPPAARITQSATGSFTISSTSVQKNAITTFVT